MNFRMYYWYDQKKYMHKIIMFSNIDYLPILTTPTDSKKSSLWLQSVSDWFESGTGKEEELVKKK